MALRRAEGIALWTAPPLYIFYWSMWPAIWVLNRSANWILRAADCLWRIAWSRPTPPTS